jgi:hypothetical protein
MKAKKLVWVIVILAAAILAMTVYATISNIAYKPTVSEMEFPFSITCEIDGETQMVEGVYVASFTSHGGYADSTQRIYNGIIVGREDPLDTTYLLNDEGSIYLYTNLYAAYLLGDPTYDYFDNSEFRPELAYCDPDTGEYLDEQSMAQKGIKLVSWDYPQPVENTFVYSHISYMTGSDAFPLTLIAAVALLAVILFVRRDKTIEKQWADTVSIIVNIAIGVITVPFFVIYGAFSDIVGCSPELSHQSVYLLAPITLLGLAVSVALRRMGCRKGCFIVQFAGAAAFVLHLLLYAVGL